MINETSFNRFMAVYSKQLARAMATYPSGYLWAPERADELAAKMSSAIVRQSFNKDSESFKWTCKELGIPHTYKAIREFITTQQ